VEPLHAGVFMVVPRFRCDVGPFVHLHALATDSAFEEDGPPDSAVSRMTALSCARGLSFRPLAAPR
jgi:hypothetical protein